MFLFSPLYQFPAWMQRLYRHVTWRRSVASDAFSISSIKHLASSSKDSSKPTIFLTFDDGPIPEVTPQILAILREKNVKATFFVVGDNVQKYPHLLKEILRDGHRVGNHTFHHLPGLKHTTNYYLRDVALCEQIIADIQSQLATQHCENKENPSSQTAKHVASAANDLPIRPLLRPPYGRMKASQKNALKDTYEIILWDILTHDYNKNYSPEKMLAIVKKYTRPGSIVVFHDSLKSNERMLAALPQIIDWWHEAGYQLQTL